VLLEAYDKTAGWMEEAIDTLVYMATKRFDYVSVGLQDASRTEASTLLSLAARVAKAGADRVRLADSVGLWTPNRVEALFLALGQAVPELEFAVHTHNDLGLANANAMAAIAGGAQFADVTVNGLGERAGNCDLATLAMTLQITTTFSTGMALHHLPALAQTAAIASGIPLSPNQPVVGANVFRHESGLHVQALLANPHAFEPFDPGLIGIRHRELLFGRYASRSAVSALLSKAGIQGVDIDGFTESLRRAATERGAPFTREEVLRIAAKAMEASSTAA
jgi:homocitrate synthase NifV